MNLAGLDAQVDAVVRAHARKGLADADKLEPRGNFDVHLNFTSLPGRSRPRLNPCDAKTAPPVSSRSSTRTPHFWATVARAAELSNELPAMICGNPPLVAATMPAVCPARKRGRRQFDLARRAALSC